MGTSLGDSGTNFDGGSLDTFLLSAQTGSISFGGVHGVEIEGWLVSGIPA